MWFIWWCEEILSGVARTPRNISWRLLLLLLVTVGKFSIINVCKGPGYACKSDSIFIKKHEIHWRQMYCKLVGFRSSHQRWSVKKGALKNFSKFAEKHLYWSPFFNKVAGLTPATLLKKTLWHKCFPVKFGKFLGTIFFQNTSERLLHWFLLNELTKSCLLKCSVSIATKMVSFLGPARLTKCVSVIYLICFYLTHLRPIFPFRTPWRKKNQRFFLVFSGGIKWEIGKKCA